LEAALGQLALSTAIFRISHPNLSEFIRQHYDEIKGNNESPVSASFREHF